MAVRTPVAPTSDLDALAGVSHIVGQSRDLADMFHAVMEHLRTAFGMERGTLALVDPATNAIVIRIAHGLDNAAIARGSYAFGEGITGRVAETGHAEAIPNISAEPEFLNRAGGRTNSADQPTAFLCVPVFVEGAIAGVLSVDKPGAAADTLDHDLQLVNVVGAILSQAMRLQSTVAELEAVKSEAEAILASMTNAVIAMNTMGQVSSLNPGAERMFGVRATTSIGRGYRDVFQGHSAFTRLVDAIISTDPDQTSTDLTIFPPSGDPVPANLVWSRLRDAEGEARGTPSDGQDS